MRRSWWMLLAPLVIACAPRPQVRQGGDGERPNIVLLIADDLRHDALGCTGGRYVSTPSFDRLAREGTLFESALVTSSLCCPSRASLLTGQYSHFTGIYNNQPEPGRFEENLIFPELLQRAGYATAFVGKWHLPNPGASPFKGFDHWVSFEDQGEYYDQELNVNGREVATSGFSTDVLTDLAVEWIERERAQPFFLMLSLKNCHKPYDPPPRHRGLLDDAEIALPPSADDPPESLPEHIRRLRLRDSERQQMHQEGTLIGELRGYYELIPSIDDSLGALLKALERCGELDRTFVVATSDNGFLWGEHGLFQKRIAYEPSIRVPLLARSPGLVPAGARENAPVLLLDLAPTFLELAGAGIPEAMQGRSLLPLLEGRDASWRTSTLHYDAFAPRFEAPQEYALRTERWKYLCSTGRDAGEALYDLAADPDERTDLSRTSSARSTLAELRAELVTALQAVDVPPGWIEAAEQTHAASR